MKKILNIMTLLFFFVQSATAQQLRGLKQISENKNFSTPQSVSSNINAVVVKGQIIISPQNYSNLQLTPGSNIVTELWRVAIEKKGAVSKIFLLQKIEAVAKNPPLKPASIMN